MGQPGLGAGGLMVEVRDRTRESFQRLASAELPVEEVEDFSLYRTLVEQDPLPYFNTLHHDYLRAFAREGPAAPGRKRFEQELWAYAQETGLLIKGAVQ